MTSKQSIAQRVLRALEMAGRERVRTELMALNDNLLVKTGYSRELLQLGPGAWPWRAETSDVELTETGFKQH